MYDGRGIAESQPAEKQFIRGWVESIAALSAREDSNPGFCYYGGDVVNGLSLYVDRRKEEDRAPNGFRAPFTSSDSQDVQKYPKQTDMSPCHRCYLFVAVLWRPGRQKLTVINIPNITLTFSSNRPDPVCVLIISIAYFSESNQATPTRATGKHCLWVEKQALCLWVTESLGVDQNAVKWITEHSSNTYSPHDEATLFSITEVSGVDHEVKQTTGEHHGTIWAELCWNSVHEHTAATRFPKGLEGATICIIFITPPTN